MFPLVSKELLEELNRRFPLNSPQITDTHTELMFKGGQRSVVDFLQVIYDDQEKSILGEL